MKLAEQDQNQLINIVDTLVEASEHFLALTRDKKYTESIYIFSSIIEGYTAVQNMINKDQELKQSLSTYENKITNNFKTISTTIENNELIKTTETLQFIFIPTLKNGKKKS